MTEEIKSKRPPPFKNALQKPQETSRRQHVSQLPFRKRFGPDPPKLPDIILRLCMQFFSLKTSHDTENFQVVEELLVWLLSIAISGYCCRFFVVASCSFVVTQLAHPRLRPRRAVRRWPPPVYNSRYTGHRNVVLGARRRIPGTYRTQGI